MKIRFSILFSIISINLFAQGIDNLWLMGYESGLSSRIYPFGGTNLTFTSNSMDTSYQRRKMNFDATNGVICDSYGNLMFSSNGIFIANAYNDTMINGSGLNPSPFTAYYYGNGLIDPQANLIIPFPDGSSKYYLFHETDDDWYNSDDAFYFYYSIIDMQQDSGKGAVIQKNVVLTTDKFTGMFLTACKHADGRDWWVINHQANSNNYFKYLVTPIGIQGPFVQSIGSIRSSEYFGQMAFSPDGSKAAFYDPIYDLDIMDFDRCTGNFSNLIHIYINDSAQGGGCAFSPNSKILYVSSDIYIYQFDLTASNIASTMTTVAVCDSFYYPSYPLFTTFGLAQLAPDGKIYLACLNSTGAMHSINNPDSLGLACDVCQHCVLLPSIDAYTVPNHPNYFLGAEKGSVCDSLEGVQNLLVQNLKLMVYPNPVVNDEVTFSYDVSSEKGDIIIYNIEGKEVAHYTLPQWSSVQHLKLPALANGLYLARLTQGNLQSTTKFLKE